jgi:hypothetical protein
MEPLIAQEPNGPPTKRDKNQEEEENEEEYGGDDDEEGKIYRISLKVNSVEKGA